MSPGEAREAVGRRDGDHCYFASPACRDRWGNHPPQRLDLAHIIRASRLRAEGIADVWQPDLLVLACSACNAKAEALVLPRVTAWAEARGWAYFERVGWAKCAERAA